MQYQRACHLLLAGRLLLAGNGAARTLAGTCVRLGALTANGQAATVTQAAVATDIHEALDVQLDLAPQVTLDLVLLLHHATEAGDLGFRQVLDPGVRADLGLDQNLLGTGESDAVDVRQGVLNALVAWKIHSGYTCHLSTLPLLVLLVGGANHVDDTLTLDDSAV